MELKVSALLQKTSNSFSRDVEGIIWSDFFTIVGYKIFSNDIKITKIVTKTQSLARIPMRILKTHFDKNDFSY